MRTAAEIAEEQAEMAYSTGQWGGVWRGDPRYSASWQEGKSAFEVNGGPPDLFHDTKPAWKSQ